MFIARYKDILRAAISESKNKLSQQLFIEQVEIKTDISTEAS